MYVASHYPLSLLFIVPDLPEPLLQPKSPLHSDFTAYILFVRLNGPRSVAQFICNFSIGISLPHQVQNSCFGYRQSLKCLFVTLYSLYCSPCTCTVVFTLHSFFTRLINLLIVTKKLLILKALSSIKLHQSLLNGVLSP